MDLFKIIEKGKNEKLKHVAKHELEELGGEKKAKRYEKAVKASKGKALKIKLCSCKGKGCSKCK